MHNAIMNKAWFKNTETAHFELLAVNDRGEILSTLPYAVVQRTRQGWLFMAAKEGNFTRPVHGEAATCTEAMVQSVLLCEPPADTEYQVSGI